MAVQVCVSFKMESEHVCSGTFQNSGYWLVCFRPHRKSSFNIPAAWYPSCNPQGRITHHQVPCTSVQVIYRLCSFGYVLNSTHFKLELCKFAYDEPRVSVSAKRGAIPIQVHVGFILAS